MDKTKMDPRIIRTRRLIKDAFIQLSLKKNFKDITIKDITAEATVNRATFYYHFIDKYDLLERVLKEDLMKNLITKIDEADYDKLNESTIVSIFLHITNFQTSLSAEYQRNMDIFTQTSETIIKNVLESVFYKILLSQHCTDNDESLRIASIMLSRGIYGATLDWQHNSTMSSEEYIKLAIPYVTPGIEFFASKEL